MRKSEALYLRGIIEQSVQALDESSALTAAALYPKWTAGSTYPEVVRVRRGDSLWRCLQTHTAMTGWEPENAPSLWARIDESHAGTLEDPIPYGGNMILTSGKYYVQDGVAYLCIRDTGNPVYHPLSALVGIYMTC